MAKFEKYLFKRSQNQTWYLVLETLQDVLGYCEMDTKKYVKALPSLKEKETYSHVSGRDYVLSITLQLAALRDEAQTKLGALVDFTAKKASGMMKCFIDKGAIIINENGGWSDKKGMFEIHDMEVLEEKYTKEDSYDWF